MLDAYVLSARGLIARGADNNNKSGPKHIYALSENAPDSFRYSYLYYYYSVFFSLEIVQRE